MPELTITSPTDVATEASLGSGDTYDFQVVSSRADVYLDIAETSPDPSSKGIILKYGMEPYPIEIPLSPLKLWIWSSQSTAADIAFEESTGGAGGGGGSLPVVVLRGRGTTMYVSAY